MSRHNNRNTARKSTHLTFAATSPAFTITELIIGMFVTAILSLTLVAFIVGGLQNYSVSSVRNGLTTDTQTALHRINDDIRNSAGLIDSPQVADANSPTIPGVWKSSSTQLVLAVAPRDNTGKALNLTGGDVTGSYASIIYYIKNGTLYRRVLGTGKAGEVTQTQGCIPADPLGGCGSDIKIASNVGNLTFTWLDQAGVVTANPAGTVAITSNLQLGRKQAGQDVAAKDVATMAPRQLGQFYTDAPFAIGPGGAIVNNHGYIVGGASTRMYIGGRVSIDFTSVVGQDGPFSPNGSVITPIGRLDVANNGCGSGANYGSTCAPAEPIRMTFFSGPLYTTKTCATGQTTTVAPQAVITGLVPGCQTPKLALPPFNKAAHTAKTSIVGAPINQNQGSSGPVIPLANNTRYNGDVTFASHVVPIMGDAYIKGNLSTNSVTFKVDDALTTRPIIMVNGQINTQFTNSVPNIHGITPIFISFFSWDSACSNSDSCSIRDPLNVYNSTVDDSVFGSTTRGGAIGSLTLLQGMAIGMSGTQGTDIFAPGANRFAGSMYAYFGMFGIFQGELVGTVAAQQFFGQNMGGSIVRLTDEKWAY